MKSLCCLHAPHSPEAGINFTFRFSAPRKLSWKTHSAQTFNAERTTVSVVKRNIHHGSQLESTVKKFQDTSCPCTLLLHSCAVAEKTGTYCAPSKGKLRLFFSVCVLLLATYGHLPHQLILKHICCCPGQETLKACDLRPRDSSIRVQIPGISLAKLATLPLHKKNNVLVSQQHL